MREAGITGTTCRILLAGGGTGGHIFPAIAIANALKRHRPGAEILFVGAQGKMEMEKVPQAGYRIEGLPIAGWNRSSLMKNIGLPVKLIRSFFRVRNIFGMFRPDAVVGVGGYSSFPVVRYAQAKGIPSFIHEANAFAGKSNILLGKQATRIFTGTEGMERFFPAGKIEVTGNPVRSVLLQQPASREDAARYFGLDPSRKTVLFTGGSLGARGINEVVAAQWQRLRDRQVQLIWQTGKPFLTQARHVCPPAEGCWVNDFIDRMELAYQAADVVVSRSGAMAIAELCVVGKPAILVPFPFAAEDHQTANAMKLVRQQAGVLVSDREAADQLMDTLLKLLADDARCRELTSQIRKLAIPDADERIAQAILTCIGN